MYKFVITRSAHGYEVYVNFIESPAGQCLSRQPYMINLVKEALATQDLRKSELFIEYDMGRVIGNTDIVETSEKDIIFYAQPPKKKVYSRYAKNRYPLPSSKLTIALEQDKDGNYEILDTWIGPGSPPFPGDEKQTTASKVYWETHALVQDSQPVQSKTITKVCPY